ncbi:hypothetical protein B0H14DRAFT_2625953 [Mycena olivaceomarginata]|nr:hypothetical protein B0H14DRAFT_2625953 [Mycena olivaceomarginata]
MFLSLAVTFRAEQLTCVWSFFDRTQQITQSSQQLLPTAQCELIHLAVTLRASAMTVATLAPLNPPSAWFPFWANPSSSSISSQSESTTHGLASDSCVTLAFSLPKAGMAQVLQTFALRIHQFKYLFLQGFYPLHRMKLVGHGANLIIVNRAYTTEENRHLPLASAKLLKEKILIVCGNAAASVMASVGPMP